jgi:hypothetical protein
LASAVAEAAGLPPPPPPSRVLPFSLMGGGAAVAIAGAIVGLDGFARSRELNRELELGEDNPSVLQPLESYREGAAFASAEKTIALISVLVGAGLIGGGVYLNSKIGGGAFAAAVLPAGSGVAVVGTF